MIGPICNYVTVFDPASQNRKLEKVKKVELRRVQF